MAAFDTVAELAIAVSAMTRERIMARVMMGTLSAAPQGRLI
jgi:hypothetical protein